MNLTYRIVRRLLRDDDVQFSRNRNFEAFEDPKVQRAMRLYRLLRSLEADLLALGDKGQVRLEAVERDDEQVVIRLSFDEANGRRVTYLEPPEWQLLLESDAVAKMLRQAMTSADAATRRRLIEDLN